MKKETDTFLGNDSEKPQFENHQQFKISSGNWINKNYTSSIDCNRHSAYNWNVISFKLEITYYKLELCFCLLDVSFDFNGFVCLSMHRIHCVYCVWAVRFIDRANKRTNERMNEYDIGWLCTWIAVNRYRKWHFRVRPKPKTELSAWTTQFYVGNSFITVCFYCVYRNCGEQPRILSSQEFQAMYWKEREIMRLKNVSTHTHMYGRKGNSS